MDLKNAFNLVSRGAVYRNAQSIFQICFLGWLDVMAMGQLTSQSGVQQGDPPGPFLFSLVWHKVAGAIKEDTECNHLLFQTWYLDNGILAGKKSSSMTLIQELGHPLLAYTLNVSCTVTDRNIDKH